MQKKTYRFHVVRDDGITRATCLELPWFRSSATKMDDLVENTRDDIQALHKSLGHEVQTISKSFVEGSIDFRLTAIYSEAATEKAPEEKPARMVIKLLWLVIFLCAYIACLHPFAPDLLPAFVYKTCAIIGLPFLAVLILSQACANIELLFKRAKARKGN